MHRRGFLKRVAAGSFPTRPLVTSVNTDPGCRHISKFLRLVVEGGGHSYQGTSHAADSFLILDQSPIDILSAIH